MNANELADMLAKSSIRKVSQGEVVVDMFEIADMLRQQQAEIEVLKLQLHTMLTNRDLRTYDGKLK